MLNKINFGLAIFKNKTDLFDFPLITDKKACFPILRVVEILIVKPNLLGASLTNLMSS